MTHKLVPEEITSEISVMKSVVISAAKMQEG